MFTKKLELIIAKFCYLMHWTEYCMQAWHTCLYGSGVGFLLTYFPKHCECILQKHAWLRRSRVMPAGSRMVWAVLPIQVAHQVTKLAVQSTGDTL